MLPWMKRFAKLGATRVTQADLVDEVRASARDRDVDDCRCCAAVARRSIEVWLARVVGPYRDGHGFGSYPRILTRRMVCMGKKSVPIRYPPWSMSFCNSASAAAVS